MISPSLKWGKSYYFPHRLVRSFVGAPAGDALSLVPGPCMSAAVTVIITLALVLVFKQVGHN